jgi:multiple sugar transport system permease protein
MKKQIAKDSVQSLGFVLPLILFLILFILVPVAGTIIISMFQDVSYLGKKFILFDNYIRMFADAGFWQSFRFTLFFIAVSVPLEMVLGMVFALLLNHTIPLRGIMRAAVLIPWAIPAAISGRTWELIYNYHYGLANFVCKNLGISSDSINWLGTGLGAFFALVVADAWKTTPFISIILLAGLQAIPGELHQQARVDRAGIFQRFFKITIPLLKPALVVALLFRTIDALRIFDLIYVLTGGGPGGTTTALSLYGYRYFIAGDFGYGSAVSVALFAVAFGLAVAYARMARFSEAIR